MSRKMKALIWFWIWTTSTSSLSPSSSVRPRLRSGTIGTMPTGFKT
jgi:hypothetical protein